MTCRARPGIARRSLWYSGHFLFLILVALASPATGDSDWPQWRGPSRDGSADASSVSEWPERLQKIWEREVGGGYSGPVSDGRYVWIHSRQRGGEVVAGLRVETGARVWRAAYATDFRQDESALSHGSGPFATPAFDRGRLFTLGVSAILSVWNADDGRLLWRKDYRPELEPPHQYFGASGSPLVWNDLCFVHFGGPERDREDGPRSGILAALRVIDGHEVWRWEGDRPAQGASPIMHRVADEWQLVSKTERLIVGFEPHSGRELWRIPYRIVMDNSIVTPIFIDKRLLTSDYESGVRAWSLHRRREKWSAVRLWHNTDIAMFTSSPVAAAGVLVGYSHYRKGHLFTMDPRTGKVLWKGRGRSGEHASLISVGDTLLAFLEDGTLMVKKVSRDGLESLQSYDLGGGSWAHPALVGDLLLVKDATRLVAWQLRGNPRSRRTEEGAGEGR